MRIIVIGAGISGCSCAHKLSHAGHRVTVVEKGRGVGGRMATRRMDGARIDHGAQFYTARDIRLQALNNQWCKEGGRLNGTIKCQGELIFQQICVTAVKPV